MNRKIILTCSLLLFATCILSICCILSISGFFVLGPRSSRLLADSELTEGRYYMHAYTADYGGSHGSCSDETNIPGVGIFHTGCGGIQLFVEFVDTKGLLGFIPLYRSVDNIPEDMPLGPESASGKALEPVEIRNGEVYWYGEKVLEL